MIALTATFSIRLSYLITLTFSFFHFTFTPFSLHFWSHHLCFFLDDTLIYYSSLTLYLYLLIIDHNKHIILLLLFFYLIFYLHTSLNIIMSSKQVIFSVYSSELFTQNKSFNLTIMKENLSVSLLSSWVSSFSNWFTESEQTSSHLKVLKWQMSNM